MVRPRKPTIIVIATLVAFSFALGVGPANGLNLGDILGGLGGGGGGGQSALGNVLKIFGIGWVINHYGGQINSAALAVMKQHKVPIEGATKVVPVVVAGKGATAIGGVQVMGAPGQIAQVKAVGGMAANLNGTNGIAGAPISGKTCGAPPANVVPDVSISMNIRFPK